MEVLAKEVNKTDLTMSTARGEKHGLINEVANSVPDNDFKYMKPETKIKAIALKKEESRYVRAQYINSRGRNERLTKPYMHWAGDLIQTWHFIPGEIYVVPMGLVNEVNDPNKVPFKRSGLVDKNDIPLELDEREEPLHRFVPIGF